MRTKNHENQVNLGKNSPEIQFPGPTENKKGREQGFCAHLKKSGAETEFLSRTEINGAWKQGF